MTGITYMTKTNTDDSIPHHLLALYGTGATAEDIAKGYNDNLSYQKSLPKADPAVVEELKDWSKAKKHLSRPSHYGDFLAFFQAEIDRMPGGWQEALRTYLFKAGDERADDMLVRMYEGVLHPLIQLMYGVEWEQPAIIATALAQASVHREKLGVIFFAAEGRVKYRDGGGGSIESLLERVRAGKEDKLDILADVKVEPETLEERTAEMYHMEIYKAVSEALDYGETPKFEFFAM